eukprot:32957-Prymnesium_polylepis.1
MGKEGCIQQGRITMHPQCTTASTYGDGFSSAHLRPGVNRMARQSYASHLRSAPSYRASPVSGGCPPAPDSASAPQALYRHCDTPAAGSDHLALRRHRREAGADVAAAHVNHPFSLGESNRKPMSLTESPRPASARHTPLMDQA